MFSSKFKQVKNKLNSKPKAKSVKGQSGLVIRTDLRAGTLMLSDGT